MALLDVADEIHDGTAGASPRPTLGRRRSRGATWCVIVRHEAGRPWRGVYRRQRRRQRSPGTPTARARHPFCFTRVAAFLVITICVSSSSRRVPASDAVRLLAEVAPPRVLGSDQEGGPTLPVRPQQLRLPVRSRRSPCPT